MMKKSVDIAIPVYYGNLQELEWSVQKQTEHYFKYLKNFDWNIVISINGKSPEKIISESKRLSEKYKNVRYLYTPLVGKGAGVLNCWKKSDADILAYMDVDLATDLKDFRKLLENVEKGYDISTGSRYHPNSKVKRKLGRRITSIGYHYFITKFLMGAEYGDAQCGFKAVSRKVLREVLPLIKDRNWFFESEMMYIAYKKGYKIKEIPINWKETWDSNLGNLLSVVFEFFIKSVELRFRKL